ncbi:MAG: hypothetical protein AAFU53_05485 [Cyanobacteria bacterium J06632_3]
MNSITCRIDKGGADNIDDSSGAVAIILATDALRNIVLTLL